MTALRVPRVQLDGRRLYGAWHRPENPAHCRAEVTLVNFTYQCRRRRGWGREHALCAQHARIEKRQERA